MTTVSNHRFNNLVNNNPCKVLIVDDSCVVRGVVRRTLEAEPAFRVVDSVNNGQEAIRTLERKKNEIDAIILDIEMPVMDGVTALPQLRKIKPDVIILMASTLTQRNAGISLECMSKGASDYIPKPDRMGDAQVFKRELIGKLTGLVETARNNKTFSTRKVAKPVNRPLVAPKISATPFAVAIGSSTGGPEALATVLAGLSGKITQPVFITQHMPESFIPVLCKHLSKKTNMNVVLGEDKTLVKDKTVYVAPGNKHMEIVKQGAQPVIRLSDAPPEGFCKPAVNPMFRSVATAYQGRVLAVILTGMGSDGLKGAEPLVSAGGTLISQSEETCVVYGMPKAVEEAGLSSSVLPLKEISESIISICNKQNVKGLACR